MLWKFFKHMSFIISSPKPTTNWSCEAPAPGEKGQIFFSFWIFILCKALTITIVYATLIDFIVIVFWNELSRHNLEYIRWFCPKFPKNELVWLFYNQERFIQFEGKEFDCEIVWHKIMYYVWSWLKVF